MTLSSTLSVAVNATLTDSGALASGSVPLPSGRP